MLAQKLLDLTIEYTTAKEYEGSVGIGLEGFGTARTLQLLAPEYGRVLKEFLAS